MDYSKIFDAKYYCDKERDEYEYESSTGSISITKKKVKNVNVYMAHLTFKKFDRFKTYYHSTATISKAAQNTGAIFCVNSSAAKVNGGGEMHNGVIPDFSAEKYCTPALYS